MELYLEGARVVAASEVPDFALPCLGRVGRAIDVVRLDICIEIRWNLWKLDPVQRQAEWLFVGCLGGQCMHLPVVPTRH